MVERDGRYYVGFQPTAANTCEAIVRWSLFSQRLINKFGVQTVDGTPVTEAVGLEVGSCIDNWAQTSMLPLLSHNLIYSGTEVTQSSDQTGWQVEIAPPPTGGTGGKSADSLPNQLAAVVSLHTDRRGRSYRGRQYVPGIALSDLAQGYVAHTLSVDLVLAYEQLQASLFALDFPCNLVIVSRQSLKTVRPVAASQLVTQVFSDPRFGTQRRRRIGVGE